MQSQHSGIANVVIAIATGDFASTPAGTLASGVKAAGDNVIGAGRLGADGHQLVVRTPLGFCVIKSYLRDLVAPLIITKAGPADAQVNVAACCMTDIDCGGGLKCTSVEDPCPGGTVTDPWLGGQLAPLTISEVRLIEALAHHVERLAGETRVDHSALWAATAKIRKAHEHRQLLFAVEDDGPGAWYDWILRLSNGAALQITLSTNPRRSAPVFKDDELLAPAALPSSRIAVVPTDTGERLLLPRMFVGD
jgi:hypothetical protein